MSAARGTAKYMIWFHSELNELFTSDRSALRKIGTCAFLLSGTMAYKFCLQSWAEMAGAGIFGFSAGAIAGTTLSLKDVVRRRIAEGRPVNFILRVYLGLGVWSILLWCATVLFVGFTVIYNAHGRF